MSRPYLSIGRLERRLSTGSTEELLFEPGVNLLTGRPNTGKTKWLQTLDYLLGDTGDNPFDGAEEEGLAGKYDAAGAELVIGEERIWVERRWRDPGVKTKVLVNDDQMSTSDFQQLLLQHLNIPLLNFPKGNPMSGQTWPELSFRMLLRHIYRRQTFWTDIADKQPEGEQHACLLAFLGIAEHFFTEDYGRLVKLKMDVERLKARREQYGQTLDELARDMVSEPGLTVGTNLTTVRNAEERIAHKIDELRQHRTELIAGARDRLIPPEHRRHVEQLSRERATIIVNLEDLKQKDEATKERLREVSQYRNDLTNELDRLARAEDAGAILADLRITHCPACDQPVHDTTPAPEHCFLCHQSLPDEPQVLDLGAVRLRFESERLIGEIKEAEELYEVLQRDARRFADNITSAEERLRMIENELIPARQAVAGLIQEEISSLDMALGELNERQRQLGRVSGALRLEQDLTSRIEAKEREIEPLQALVNEMTRSVDFDAVTAYLEDGMNTYLNLINTLRPGVWQHNAVKVDITRSSFSIRVGNRRWGAVLGGTDTLYFLMAYHYGLLTLSNKPELHYPGLSIIDVPGEFSGEAVEDKENFIVQPFIDLLTQEDYQGAQLIITGVSFTGLDNAHRLHLARVYVA